MASAVGVHSTPIAQWFWFQGSSIMHESTPIAPLVQGQTPLCVKPTLIAPLVHRDKEQPRAVPGLFPNKQNQMTT